MSSTDELSQGETATQATSGGLFVRQATGFVREVKPSFALGFNFITGAPMFAIGVGLFAGLSGFPGGSFPLATLIALPLGLGVVYTFGLLTVVIPRSGGDYILVGRILHPALAMMSSVSVTVAVLLSVAFEAFAFVTLGLAPSLTIVGLLGHSHTLVNWANTISTSHGWQLAIGAVLIIGSCFLLALGWTTIRRVMIPLLLFALGGLVISVLVAVFTSRGSFIQSFNSFAAPYTHTHDAYAATQATAQHSGVVFRSFSFSQTIPMTALLLSGTIFAWNSVYFAGEMRQARTWKAHGVMALATVLIMASISLFSAVLLSSWGKNFVASLFGGATPKALGSAPPSYFVLTSAQIGSTVVAVFLCLAFLAFFPIWMMQTALPQTRWLFAWAFDGMAPRRLAYVNKRNVPIVAVALTALACAATLVWALYVAKNFIQVVTYATFTEFVTFLLVAASAIALPWRRPELYRASGANHKVLGIPMIVLPAIVCICTIGFITFAYLHWPFFGFVKGLAAWAWALGPSLVGLGIYFTALLVRRRQGIDLNRVYQEIPPE